MLRASRPDDSCHRRPARWNHVVYRRVFVCDFVTLREKYSGAPENSKLGGSNQRDKAMTDSSLKATPIYKHFGINGLKWFAYAWFPFPLLIVTLVPAAIIYCAARFPTTSSAGIILVVLFSALVAIALLAKMWRQHWKAIREIEADPSSRIQ